MCYRFQCRLLFQNAVPGILYTLITHDREQKSRNIITVKCVVMLALILKEVCLTLSDIGMFCHL